MLKPVYENVRIYKKVEVIYERSKSSLCFSIKVNCISPTKKNRSNRLEVFLGKGALEICSKLTVEHPCRSAISVKL